MKITYYQKRRIEIQAIICINVSSSIKSARLFAQCTVAFQCPISLLMWFDFFFDAVSTYFRYCICTAITMNPILSVSESSVSVTEVSLVLLLVYPFGSHYWATFSQQHLDISMRQLLKLSDCFTMKLWVAAVEPRDRSE